jgi:hypothetical protein
VKSHFADEERLRGNGKRLQGQEETLGKKTLDKYIFGKSHFENEERLRENTFADEERLRGMKREFGGKRENTGQIHTWEVSLRKRRETSGKLLRKTKRDFELSNLSFIVNSRTNSANSFNKILFYKGLQIISDCPFATIWQ